MCGLIHVKRFDGKPARKMLEKRYRAQKTRGQEGFGYVAIDDDHLVNYARSAKEDTILKNLNSESANEIMFHHRFPTSTANIKECAHPIVVNHSENDYVYFIIHNGIITNNAELKAKHEKLGYKYQTELEIVTRIKDRELFRDLKWNDSEALAIELARDLDKAKAGLSEVRGSIAFIALQAERESKKAVKLFYGRNYGSPLVVDKNGNYFAITSEGKGEIVPVNILYEYDYKANTCVSKAYTVGQSGYYSSHYNWRDYDKDEEIEYAHKHIGYNKPLEDVKLLKEGDYDTYAEEYWNLKEEQQDLQDILREWHGGDGDEAERSEYVYQLADVNKRLALYDDKEPNPTFLAS